MLYQAKVKVKIEDDKGKTKKQTYVHLIKDDVISGVEDQVTKLYTGSVNDWELVSVSETKIVSIVIDGKEYNG